MATPESSSAVEPAPRVWPWFAGFSAIGIAAVLVPPLAVPASVLTLIAGLSFPSTSSRRTRRLGHAATAFAVIGTVIGLGRFAVSNAMLGMVESGESAAAKSALYRLREVVLAEDATRKLAVWDPDGDHIGSASLIAGLTGALPIRDGKRVSAPLLNYAFHGPVETPRGPSLQVEGYLFMVCLPTKSGGLTARDDGSIDDERSERRYVAYAWPADAQHGMNTLFFADEHERLLVVDLPRGTPSPYVGSAKPPACDAALGKDGLEWKVWKNKKPRSTLPGDTSETPH